MTGLLRKVELIVLAALSAASFTACKTTDTGSAGQGEAIVSKIEEVAPLVAGDPTVKDTGEVTMADMSGYSTYEKKTDYRFIKASVSDVLAKAEAKDSFALYLAKPDASFCDATMPVLNKAATAMNDYVYYIEIGNTEDFAVNYSALTKLIQNAVRKDKTGTTFEIPLVCWIQDGELASFDKGAPAGPKDLSQDNINSLYASYIAAFGALQSVD